ncbi:MAG: hypothetical protein DMG14_13550 [Acidobacteria bacterium]|nr:MAG: hypothetical protein DMG14_13550 [Acidobacteriota bacterium]
MRNQWMKEIFAVVLVAAGFFLLSVSMFAHHGTNISYDQSNPVTLKGVMTDFYYRNPHPQVFFDVTDESGNVKHWVGEIAPTPFTLSQHGWNKSRSTEALKPGTKITITLGPSRVGTPVGVVMKILNEKGEELLDQRAGEQ